ncbi:hypothetical protein DFP72DRAFT_289475 [Ephemerocybe angulata]|uniref:Uncharacterized protein n=1 Tax=Ephemerocybe angulata TaxID=980116 RepID=A0A8H6H874_9AGAR|nr:hypothetical protein DFP72DRAFT_289475 [Tulosesus angulatus]
MDIYTPQRASALRHIPCHIPRCRLYPSTMESVSDHEKVGSGPPGEGSSFPPASPAPLPPHLLASHVSDDRNPTIASATAALPPRLERERLHLDRLKQQDILPEDARGEEFQGFQGSGSMAPPAALGHARSASVSSSSGSGSGSRSQSDTGVVMGGGSRTRSSSLRRISRLVQEEEFGDFIDVPTDSVPSVPEDDEDPVDLDGGMYAGSGSGRRSYAAKRATSPGSGSVVSDERSPLKDPLRMHSRTYPLGE